MKLAKTIWDKLSSVDVTEQTTQKNGYTYLTWCWAWAKLMESFPTAVYRFEPEHSLPDGSVMCQCEITITDGQETVSHSMWLAVMDHRNKAIQNPDATQVNKARMRCLVKCIAMFGLGAYIYANEDIPTGVIKEQSENISEAQHDEIKERLHACGANEKDFLKYFKVECLSDLKVSQITKVNSAITAKEKRNKEQAA